MGESAARRLRVVSGPGAGERRRRVEELRAAWLAGELDLSMDDAGLERMMREGDPRSRPRPVLVALDGEPTASHVEGEGGATVSTGSR